MTRNISSLKDELQNEIYGELSEIIPDPSGSGTDGATIGGYINEFLALSGKKDRQLFTVRYYYNMPIRDISAAAKMNEPSVRTRLSEIRADLREFLEERGVEL